MGDSVIQPLVSLGYGLAALVLGNACQQYRATSAASPVTGTALATIQAIFSQQPNLSFAKAADYKKAGWYAAFDPTAVLVGDYLVGPQGTFFVASLPPVSPYSAPFCILCNHTLTVSRQPEDSSVGVQPYGGDVVANETVLMTSWPGSVLETGRAAAGDTKLPGDEPMPWFDILLPVYAPAVLREADILTDETNRRYRISGAELTTLGWRLHAIVTVT